MPPSTKGKLTVVIVRASDLQRAVAAQNPQDITDLQSSNWAGLDTEKQSRKGYVFTNPE